VAERTTVGLDAVVQFGASEAHLKDGPAPAAPQEPGRFVAREIAGARLAGLRQEDVDELAVEAELAMIGDRGPDICESTCRSATTPDEQLAEKIGDELRFSVPF